MKTILKYEQIINEALRSALDYETPDEEINEFIRFSENIFIQIEFIFLRMIVIIMLQIIHMNGVLIELYHK